MTTRPLDGLVATTCKTCGNPSGGPQYYRCECDLAGVVHVTDPGYTETLDELADAMDAAGWPTTDHRT